MKGSIEKPLYSLIFCKEGLSVGTNPRTGFERAIFMTDRRVMRWICRWEPAKPIDSRERGLDSYVPPIC
jgi:hypothetical protein